MNSPKKQPSAERKKAQLALARMPAKERARFVKIEMLRRGLEPKKG